MKNLKKVLAFVVVFAMMFTMAVSASSFKDVADDASYAEAVTILNALGLMIGDDEGNFNPDQSITRAEAATVIVRAKGLDGAAAGAVGATAFTDVPADHWASGYINIATQSGIVAGYGDGTFGPSNPVTYEQMVKLIVAALGYTPKAEANGGYPTGYLVIASQKNITKGATGNAGDPAPRKTVARLIYNALDVNMMEQTVFTKGSEEYQECKPERYLLHDLGISKYEGRITNTYASLGKTDSEEITMEYDKAINSDESSPVTFDSFGKTDAADYLGYYVTVYSEIDDDTDDDTILAIAPKSGKNDVIELDYSQVETVDLDANGKIESIDYVINQNDSNEQTLDLADSVKYYYNGKSDSDSAVKFIKNIDTANEKPGKIKFVSNNGSDDYNVVFVTEYTSDLLVSEVNASRMTVFDKDGNKIDFDKEDVVYTIYKDGEVATFDDIAVGDVLTQAKSSDGKLVSVFVSTKSVTGTVTEETSDDDPYYRIDGGLYRVADQGPSVKVGDNGTFYLNVDDRIVSKDATAGKAGGTYAYVIQAKKDEDGLNGDKVQIKYLTTDGKWETNYLASKLIVHEGDTDYDAIDPAKETNPAFSKLYDKDNDKIEEQQLIKFSTNSAGEIKNIYIAANGSDDDNFSLDRTDNKAYYKADNQKLGTKIFVEDNTIVFNVPDKADPETFDEKDFTASNARATFSDDVDYDIAAYDIDEDYPAIIIAYGAKTEIDAATRVLVLTSVATGRNDNDEKVTKFYGYQEGQSVSANASEDGIDYFDVNGQPIAAPELKAGDAVIFSLDGAGDIDKIQVLFQASKAKTTVASYENVDAFAKGADIENFFGVAVKKASGGKLTVDLKGTAKEKDNIIPVKGSYNVYEVNVNRSTPVVSVSDYASIDVARSVDKGESIDKVYVRQYDGDVYDIVVYTYTADADYEYAE